LRTLKLLESDLEMLATPFELILFCLMCVQIREMADDEMLQDLDIYFE
jgi:hypothetical protein